jgi:hypothetical protein
MQEIAQFVLVLVSTVTGIFLLIHAIKLAIGRSDFYIENQNLSKNWKSVKSGTINTGIESERNPLIDQGGWIEGERFIPGGRLSNEALDRTSSRH